MVFLLSQLVTNGSGGRLGSSVSRGGTVVSVTGRLRGASTVAVSPSVASTATTPSPQSDPLT